MLFRFRGLLLSSIFICSCHTLADAADFDGNGSDEVALWERDTGVFLAISADGTQSSRQCGLPGDISLTGDLDGDGHDEAIVFRVNPAPQSTGAFYGCFASGVVQTRNLGKAGDIPLTTTDFDGDGKVDESVFNPSSGEWAIWLSASSTIRQANWGEPGDLPVPGDYDGDGKGDLAVYRPKNGMFLIVRSGDGGVSSPTVGILGDLPVPSDYDGDRQIDPAVFRKSSGTWIVSSSAAGGNLLSAQFGQSEDIPTPADLNGDGRSDLVVYRPFAGAILWAQNPDSLNPASGPVRSNRIAGVFVRKVVPNSIAAREHIFADYDGDGRTDYATARLTGTQVTWYVADSAGRPIHQQPWGIVGDRLVPGDFDGDGIFDFGIVRSTSAGGMNWYFMSSRNRIGWSSAFGLASDIVRAADFDGDGKTDQVAIRADASSSLQWFVSRSAEKTAWQRNWGFKGDLPITADFNGDGRSDLAVVRNQGGLLYWYGLTNDGVGLPVMQWGLAGDTVVPGDYDGDGRADFAVARAMGGLVYTFVRTQSGTPLAMAQWGLAGDEIVHGYYTGSKAMQLGVWRPGPFAPTYFVDRSASLVQRTSQFFTQLPWGLPKDTVITPQTVGMTIAANSSSTPPPPAPPSSTPSTTPPSGAGNPPPAGSSSKLAALCPTIRELGAPELYKRGSSSHIPGSDYRSGKPSYIGKIRSASNPAYACVDILDSRGNKISAFGRYAGAGTNYQFRYYVGHNASRCGGGQTASEIDLGHDGIPEARLST